MTIIKYSGLIADHRGKLNGSIFSKNHAGFIQKNLASPHNPMSFTQVNNRNSWQYLISHYSTLSQELRNDWDKNGLDIIWYNKVGEPYHPTGQLLFLSCNQNLFAINQPFIDMFDPSSPFTCIDSGSLDTYFYGDQSFTLRFPNYTTEEYIYHVVYATPPLSKGINYSYKYFKAIAVIPPGTGNYFDFYLYYFQRFGLIPMDKKIFVKTRPVNGLNGIQGQEFICNTITKVADPLDFPNLIAGFRAGVGVALDGNYVNGWQDCLTGMKSIVPTDTSLRPTFISDSINGKPAIRFNGLCNFNLSHLLPIGQPFSILMIFKPSNYSDEDIIFIQRFHNPYEFTVVYSYTNLNMFCGVSVGCSGISRDYAHALGFIANEDNSMIFDSGAAQVVGSAGSNNVTNLLLGVEDSAQGAFIGDVAELYFYSGVISDSDMLHWGGYANYKYKIPIV